MTLRFVLAGILLVVAVIAIAVGDRDIEGDHVPIRKIGTVVLGLSAFFLLFSCVRIVSTGEVGIPVVFGKPGTPLGAGVHITNPFADVQKLSVRTENYTMSGVSTEGDKAGNDAVPVLGADGAPAEVESTVLFHLNESDASNVFRELGPSYVDKVLRPAARSCVRDEFGKLPLVEAATSGRGKVSANVQDCIDRETNGRGLTVESFQLRDVKVDQSVQDTINAKVSAQQNAEKQQFDLQTTKQQAEIARVDAQGKADAQQIISCGGHAEGEGADVHVVPNVGDACQNNLSQNYLMYLYIQSLQKIAESQSNSTLIVPFDQNLTPLLNIGPH